MSPPALAREVPYPDGARGGMCDLPEPETLADMRAELLLLRQAIEALRRELIRARLLAADASPPPGKRTRLQRRDELLRELAAGTGLGPTKAGAVAVLLTLAGARPAPEGMEATLAELHELGPLPTAWETIYRALTR